MLLNRFFFLLSVSVVSTAAVECFYKGDLLPGGHFVQLLTMECEDGCCGTTDHQECCDNGGLNLWMVFAFIFVGLFTIFAIVAAVYVILKKKNKKKERVGNTESNPAQDQPSTIDLSVFNTSDLKTSDPPAYTIHHDRALNHYSKQGDYQENTLPTKLPAEHEEMRVPMDPDLTAECTNISHTPENSAEFPTLGHFTTPSNTS